jgi:cytochrome P450
VISSPANLEYVLKNETLVTKGDFFRTRAWDLFGHGIINATGPLWRAQRKAGLKFFSGSTLDALVEEVLPDLWQDVEASLASAGETQKPADLQRVFHDLTTSLMGTMAYSMPLTASHPFSKAFDSASANIASRFQNPLYPLTELLNGSPFRTAVSTVKSFGLSIVSSAKRRRGALAFNSLVDGSPEAPPFNTLIDSLIEALPNDPSLIADAAMNFLSAGRDTTAESLTWTLYALLRHPAVLRRLRDDVAKSFPNKKSLEKLMVASLQPSQIPYVQAVFYEALRLYPPVPIEIQQTEQAIMLPDGTALPKGSVVVWCLWAMNRSRELYGEDAEVFRPERWLSGDGKFVPPKDNYVFAVFNGGPRACLGRKMAELLGCWVLVRWCGLLEEGWEVEEVNREGERWEEAWERRDEEEAGKEQEVRKERVSGLSLTLPMEGGLPVWVRQR